ncbi:hypothetical protein REMIM1_PC00207 (plasmid) [Rhizobium etli bv. mimosae str. Mim1]|nr:hypothetical protein REMIM1_PC00207 [Rhizobium etli bv. mimosae str. Mim1]
MIAPGHGERHSSVAHDSGRLAIVDEGTASLPSAMLGEALTALPLGHMLDARETSVASGTDCITTACSENVGG